VETVKIAFSEREGDVGDGVERGDDFIRYEPAVSRYSLGDLPIHSSRASHFLVVWRRLLDYDGSSIESGKRHVMILVVCDLLLMEQLDRQLFTEP
jgi:hypothetical protein